MSLYASATCATAQTNTALVPAKTNDYVHLVGLYISSDTAVTVDLVDSASHTLVWRQYVAANGGSAIQGDLAESLLGEGLDFTTSTTANVFLSVTYDYGT